MNPRQRSNNEKLWTAELHLRRLHDRDHRWPLAGVDLHQGDASTEELAHSFIKPNPEF